MCFFVIVRLNYSLHDISWKLIVIPYGSGEPLDSGTALLYSMNLTEGYVDDDLKFVGSFA